MRFAIGVAVLAAVAAIGAWGAPVDEATALTVAERFLQTSKMAARALPDRSVESIEQRGNLWIARLEPSGHILVSGSDRATPIIGFSENDFSEGEEDSAERAMLDAAACIRSRSRRQRERSNVGLMRALVRRIASRFIRRLMYDLRTVQRPILCWVAGSPQPPLARQARSSITLPYLRTTMSAQGTCTTGT